MVNGHQADGVKEVGLLQLGGDAKRIDAIFSLELVATDLDPVLGLEDAGRILRIDFQAKWAAPDTVGDKDHFLAIPGEQEWAATAEALVGDDRASLEIRASFGLRGAGWPDNARDVEGGIRAQANMDLRAGDGLLLVEQASAHFDFATYSECVDFDCWAIWTLGLQSERLPFVSFWGCAICDDDTSIG